jgi:predicted ArsR family transcriptional regulator
VQSVRKRILEILKRRKRATVAEIAHLLDMAPVSVRYHLDILQGDNLIAVSQVRREGSVGRPQQLYSLTADADEHFPDNYPALTAGLVQQLKKVLPADQLQAAFSAVAQEMAAELTLVRSPERPEGPADEGQWMDGVVGFLNDRGYLARWERQSPAEEPESETILLHTFNCPYACLSGEHPELCGMDLALMQELTGRPCERTDALAQGGNCCTYQFQL